MSNKLKGKLGEELAKKFLIENGYEILEQNFRYSRYGEIDIIAYKNGIISFVEVKYRTSDAFGMPLEAITSSKLQKIYMSAKYYLTIVKKRYKSYTIDAISILENGNNTKINHIKNIQL